MKNFPKRFFISLATLSVAFLFCILVLPSSVQGDEIEDFDWGEWKEEMEEITTDWDEQVEDFDSDEWEEEMEEITTDWDELENEADETYDEDDYDYDEVEALPFGTTQDTDTTSGDEELAFLGMMFAGNMIVMIALYVYKSLSLMTIANKLGVANAWLAWIPIADVVVFLQSAKLNSWLVLLLLIPFVNFIAMLILGIMGFMKISERRGFASWLGILCIVPIANIVLPGYLAWAEPKTVKAQV